MISDRDIWAAALLMLKRYGDDAMLEAAARADKPLDEGDVAGAESVAPHPERNRAVASAEAGGGGVGSIASSGGLAVLAALATRSERQ